MHAWENDQVNLKSIVSKGTLPFQPIRCPIQPKFPVTWGSPKLPKPGDTNCAQQVTNIIILINGSLNDEILVNRCCIYEISEIFCGESKQFKCNFVDCVRTQEIEPFSGPNHVLLAQNLFACGMSVQCWFTRYQMDNSNNYNLDNLQMNLKISRDVAIGRKKCCLRPKLRPSNIIEENIARTCVGLYIC